jgi:glycyl-tRNA synthetase
MEMEYFVPPAEAAEWYQYWCEERYQWYLDLGMPADRLRLRPRADELSHYSSGTSTWSSCSLGLGRARGIANRGDFDLTAHATRPGRSSTTSTTTSTSATRRT